MWSLPFAMPKSVVRQFGDERNDAEPRMVWLPGAISSLFADRNGGGTPRISPIG
jgi:hypothetical protein